MNALVNERSVQANTISVPELRGKFQAMAPLNQGTVCITTTYGVYTIYRNAEKNEVRLISVFGETE